MIALLCGVGMAMLPALVHGSVSVDAGLITSVSVNAAIFDERSTSPYGCPPDGCVGLNTRVSATISCAVGVCSCIACCDLYFAGNLRHPGFTFLAYVCLLRGVMHVLPDTHEPRCVTCGRNRMATLSRDGRANRHSIPRVLGAPSLSRWAKLRTWKVSKSVSFLKIPAEFEQSLGEIFRYSSSTAYIAPTIRWLRLHPGGKTKQLCR